MDIKALPLKYGLSCNLRLANNALRSQYTSKIFPTTQAIRRSIPYFGYRCKPNSDSAFGGWFIDTDTCAKYYKVMAKSCKGLLEDASASGYEHYALVSQDMAMDLLSDVRVNHINNVLTDDEEHLFSALNLFGQPLIYSTRRRVLEEDNTLRDFNQAPCSAEIEIRMASQLEIPKFVSPREAAERAADVFLKTKANVQKYEAYYHDKSRRSILAVARELWKATHDMRKLFILGRAPLGDEMAKIEEYYKYLYEEMGVANVCHSEHLCHINWDVAKTFPRLNWHRITRDQMERARRLHEYIPSDSPDCMHDADISETLSDNSVNTLKYGTAFQSVFKSGVNRAVHNLLYYPMAHVSGGNSGVRGTTAMATMILRDWYDHINSPDKETWMTEIGNLWIERIYTFIYNTDTHPNSLRDAASFLGDIPDYECDADRETIHEICQARTTTSASLAHNITARKLYYKYIIRSIVGVTEGRYWGYMQGFVLPKEFIGTYFAIRELSQAFACIAWWIRHNKDAVKNDDILRCSLWEELQILSENLRSLIRGVHLPAYRDEDCMSVVNYFTWQGYDTNDLFTKFFALADNVGEITSTVSLKVDLKYGAIHDRCAEKHQYGPLNIAQMGLGLYRGDIVGYSKKIPPNLSELMTGALEKVEATLGGKDG